MTNTNKLIVGAVVVLGALYLYDRNRKMKAVAELKAQAEAEAKSEAQVVSMNTPRVQSLLVKDDARPITASRMI